MPASNLGFREHPFGPGFDSRYYYARPGQEEKLRQLLSKIRAREGPLLVTGDPGTGKTTLLNRLILELQAVHPYVFFFASPAPSLDVLLDTCLAQVGLQPETIAGHTQKTDALRSFFCQVEDERPAALFADEAQSATDEVLEGLFELSAPDDQGRSALPVVLAGDLNLESILSQDLYLPLWRSIGFHYRLTRLDDDEIAPFIHHRLRAAGCTENDTFSPEAVARIAYYSDGVPRKINTLGELSLFIAQMESKTRVTAETVELAAYDALLREEQPSLPLPPSPGQSPGGQHRPVFNPPPVTASTRIMPAAEEAAQASLSKVRGQHSPAATVSAPAESREERTPEAATLRLDVPQPSGPSRAVTPGLACEKRNAGTAPPTPRRVPTPSRQPKRPPKDTGGPAPTSKPSPARRSRWVAYMASVVGLAVVAVVAGGAWSLYDPRLDLPQPVLSVLERAIQVLRAPMSPVTDDSRPGPNPNNSNIPPGVSAAANERAQPTTVPEAEALAQTGTPSSAAVATGRIPANSEGSRPGAIEHRLPTAESPETPSAQVATPEPTAYQLSSWNTKCELLTSVNVHERPATYSRLTHTFPTGSHVLLTGRVPDSNWYRVQGPAGGEGFVYGGLVPRAVPIAASEGEASAPPFGLLQLDQAGAESNEIAQLLASAETHVRADRLMAPRFNNALAAYRKVLRADPENAEALAGIETIKAKLLRFAFDAAGRGDAAAARSQLNKVLAIDAEDEVANAALATFGEEVSPEDFAGLEAYPPER